MLNLPKTTKKFQAIKLKLLTVPLHLKKKNLVICVNEDVRKGRLYKCTDLGKSVAKKL